MNKRVVYWNVYENNGIQYAYFEEAEVKTEPMSLWEIIQYKLGFKHFDVVK